MPIDPSKLGNWGFIYDALVERGLGIVSDENTQFQFVSTPQRAAWTTDTNQYYGDLWGNNAPQSLGPTTTGPQVDIGSAYFEFISSLVLPVPDSAPYQKLKAQLQSLADDKDGLVEQSYAAYRKWKQSDGDLFPDITTYSDWLASSQTNGTDYREQLADFDRRIAAVNLQLVPYESGLYGPYTEAVKAADPANKVSVIIPSSSDTKLVYDTRLSPPLADFLAQVQGGGKVNPLAVNLDSDHHYSGKWHVEGGATADADFDIFGFVTEGGVTVDKEIEKDESFSVALNIQGLTTINVARNNWMKTNMIAEHMSGPFAGTGQSPAMFFGDQGSLKLVPTQLLVAYGVTFSLTISNSYYEKTKTSWENATGVLIGPFFIGFEASGHSVEVKQSNDVTTVSIGSTDDTNAYVIGVSSALFHDTSGAAAMTASEHEFQRSLLSASRAPSDTEWSALTSQFPGLAGSRASVAILGEPTPTYNCIAWSMGFTDRWINPSSPLSAFQRQYAAMGYEVTTTRGASAFVDGWGKSDGDMTHGSRVYANNQWSSKLGSWYLISHPRAGLVGDAYGRILTSFRRSTGARTERSLAAVEPLTSSHKQRIRALAARVARDQRDAFEQAFAAWKATWFKGPFAAVSDSRDHRNCPEFVTLVDMGGAVLPLVVDKLAAPENFVALVLYDELQRDPALRLTYDGEDAGLFAEGEQARAARTVKHWLDRAQHGRAR